MSGPDWRTRNRALCPALFRSPPAASTITAHATMLLDPAKDTAGRSIPAGSPTHPPAAEAIAPAVRRPNVMLGIVLVMASTFFFSISDVTAKHLTQSLPPLQVAWLRYLVFCVIAVGLAGLSREGGRPMMTARPGLQALRGVFMAGSALLFILGLSRLPVADATAMAFLAPLFIMAISVAVLGEQVGIRRWIAAAVGLAGVLLIVRPGSSAFHPAAFLPVGSALMWACTVVATRKMSRTERPETTLLWSALTGFVILTAVVPFYWSSPGLAEIGFGCLVGVASTFGQWLMIRGYGSADASVLAPFSYSQLIWATALGLLVFGTLPGPWTFVGAAVIAGSGLYIAHRERVRASRPAS